MGWPPAVVIVVRHGARLDAADKQWHLTSPTPYDPPLTYGGWTQSRALGSRIASILRSRESDEDLPPLEAGEGHDKETKRRRRHKVVIHTSPFLRCVQTSVAISAGLSQNPGLRRDSSRPTSAVSPALRPHYMHSSPRIRPTLSTNSPSLTPIHEPSTVPDPKLIRKSTIRVDAFLGEWLSPDYFEFITPPPSSVMMVAGAKADLLRREDYSNIIQTAKDATSAPSNQFFPGGWGSPVVVAQSAKEKDESALSALPALGQALPRRDRTSSLSSVGSASSNGSHGSSKGSKKPVVPTLVAPSDDGIYQVPVPNYAISSSDPIPPGYVAHARDSCVDIDYQWDSMREPQEWGNGGEYGEEWSSMHKRFRKGLQDMIGWYETTEDPAKMLLRTPNKPAEVDTMTPDDDETDLVLILVTHGAGCNALIGALTNQPVLMDVAMASLTMAVRKQTPVSSRTSSPSHSRTSSRTLSISEQYDVKLVANNDHLRSSSNTPSASRNPSTSALGVFRERDRAPPRNPYDRNASPRAYNTSSSLGSIRRTASVATSNPRTYTAVKQNSFGLWSPKPVAIEPEEEQDDMILNFGNDGSEVTAAAEKSIEREEVGPKETPPSKQASATSEEKEDDEDVIAPLGLWGSTLSSAEADQKRELTPKRRWTVNERSLK